MGNRKRWLGEASIQLPMAYPLSILLAIHHSVSLPCLFFCPSLVFPSSFFSRICRVQHKSPSDTVTASTTNSAQPRNHHVRSSFFSFPSPPPLPSPPLHLFLFFFTTTYPRVSSIATHHRTIPAFPTTQNKNRFLILSLFHTVLFTLTSGFRCLVRISRGKAKALGEGKIYPFRINMHVSYILSMCNEYLFREVRR